MTQVPEQKKDEFKQILEDLNSSKEVLIFDALKQLRNKGNELTTSSVINLLAKQPSAELQTEITNYLLDLRNESAIQPLIDAIENPDLREYKHLLISVFWQSSLDGSDHLLFFVEQTYDASYEEILETLTVIEDLKGPFQEDELFEAISRINEISYEEDDEQKRNLLSSIIEVLNQY